MAGASPPQLRRLDPVVPARSLRHCASRIAWMSDTFVSGNQTFLVARIEAMAEWAPWTFALAMVAVSRLL